MGWQETFHSLFGGRAAADAVTPIPAPAPAKNETPGPFSIYHLAVSGVQTSRALNFLRPLNDAAREFDIVTTGRASMFLAQLSWESGHFEHLVELWGPTPAQQRYEGRADLGNVQPGDGFKFRGRGLIQITGRANYTSVATFFHKTIDETVAWLETPEGACFSAAWYWAKHGCNELADVGDFVGVTRSINGGVNGLEGRAAIYQPVRVALVQRPSVVV